MPNFNMGSFAQALLAGLLFYDREYGALGVVCLIDEETNRERFLASYDPEGDTYLIEEATEWEDPSAMEADESDFVMATDGKEHMRRDDAESAAGEFLLLAMNHNLIPVFEVLFEDDA
jgi:hypothetical protein